MEGGVRGDVCRERELKCVCVCVRVCVVVCLLVGGERV